MHWGTMRNLLALIAFFALAAQAVIAEPLSPDRQRKILRTGLEAFDEAIEVMRTKPNEAKTHFQEAVDAFESLEAAGIDNADLQYNLGNAYYRLGDNGRAILAYRRALRFDPSSHELKNNLDFVRKQVTPYIVPSDERKLLHRVFFWHFSTSVATRFWIAVALSIVGWGLLALRVLTKRKSLAWSGLLVVIAALVVAGSVSFELYEQQTKPAAVIVAGEQVLRLGQGEGFDAALSEPLKAGIELQILSTRGSWLQIELRDGVVGWILDEGVERV